MAMGTWKAAKKCPLAYTLAVKPASCEGSCPSTMEGIPGISMSCSKDSLQHPCLKLSAPAGEVQASKEIASGALQAGSFRFFSGLMEWESSRLLQDIQRGLWWGLRLLRLGCSLYCNIFGQYCCQERPAAKKGLLYNAGSLDAIW
jgi:hypothetical protein